MPVASNEVQLHVLECFGRHPLADYAPVLAVAHVHGVTQRQMCGTAFPPARRMGQPVKIVVGVFLAIGAAQAVAHAAALFSMSRMFPTES